MIRKHRKSTDYESISTPTSRTPPRRRVFAYLPKLSETYQPTDMSTIGVQGETDHSAPCNLALIDEELSNRVVRLPVVIETQIRSVSLTFRQPQLPPICLKPKKDTLIAFYPHKENKKHGFLSSQRSNKFWLYRPKHNKLQTSYIN